MLLKRNSKPSLINTSNLTPQLQVIFATFLLLILSITALMINALSTHYLGNNYFPPHALLVALSLSLMYVGFTIQWGRTHRLTEATQEMMLFFLMMAVVALATNATQYTPFAPIDRQLLKIEQHWGMHLDTLLQWTHEKPTFKTVLEFIYDSLPYQMAFFPLLLIANRRTRFLYEYYFLLLSSVIMGFSFYYFFPTTAPASILAHDYFSEAQQATGLKFMQIHQHLPPTTLEGGLISLPSFHTIWAWFCVYMLRGWPVAVIIMLPINLLLMASCLLLGWHYVLDILGAILVIISSHGFYYLSIKQFSSVSH